MNVSEIGTFAPRWKEGVEIAEQAEVVIIRRFSKEYAFRGSAAALLRRMRRFIDDASTVDAIIAKSEVEREPAGELLGALWRFNLVGLADGRGHAQLLVDPKVFYAQHKDYCQTWLEPVYRHPFWEKVTSGRASREQIIGFAFEKYHYIEGAHEHMALAAANATPELMPHLARHFIEEYTHGDIYRRGLRSLFSNEAILGSQALPSTRALVNFLNESAMRSSFSYYAGNELLQATENTDSDDEQRAISTFYAKLLEHYPWAKALVKSFEEHTRLDQSLGHESAFLQMCEAMPPLTPREVEDALATTKRMAEHLELFMDGIDGYYGRRNIRIPRMPSDLLSI
jgi:pyrroloquinoline quinone (PQQ) biosynthesis protein C